MPARQRGQELLYPRTLPDLTLYPFSSGCPSLSFIINHGIGLSPFFGSGGHSSKSSKLKGSWELPEFIVGRSVGSLQTPLATGI